MQRFSSAGVSDRVSVHLSGVSNDRVEDAWLAVTRPGCRGIVSIVLSPTLRPPRGETGARDDILRWTCIFRPRCFTFQVGYKKQTKSRVAVGGQLERANRETHALRP